MDTLLQDLRYGVRLLVKSPGFALVAVVTLALGIGANTAIFSVVNGVVLRPLAFAEPEQLVWGWGSFSGNQSASVSPPDFLDYREQNQVFESLAARTIDDLFNLTGDDEPQLARGHRVSAGYFETIGIRPALGRTFRAEEERPGNETVAILSHGLWQRRFGGDPSILGREITVDGRLFQVVGVMPEFHDPTSRAEIWTPLAFNGPGMSVRRFHFLRVIGRLKPGVTVEQAQAQLDGIAAQLESQYPDSNKTWKLRLVPLHEQVVGDLRTPLYFMLAAVAFVLLIACANVANLMFARSVVRQKEMAVRAALGAGRGRIVRQLLTESVLLALAGGGAGLLLAIWGVDTLRAFGPDNLPRLDEVRLDGRVLGFTLLLSLLTGIVFGLAPALRATRADAHASLKEGGRGTAGQAQRWTRDWLVASEVALSLMLLVSAGLLVNSYLRMLNVDPGFDAEGVLTGRLLLDEKKYRDPDRRAAHLEALLERVRAIPGVEAAGLMTALPLTRQGGDTYFTIEGRPRPEGSEKLLAQERSATSEYFQAMRIPLLRDRWFDGRDRRGAPGAVLINESFAQTFFPGEDPLGKRLIIDLGQPFTAEIVGVVGSVRQGSLAVEPWPEMYRTAAQTPPMVFNLVLRAAQEPASLAGAVRAAVWEVDAQQALSDVRTMRDVIGQSVAPQRFQSLLVLSFAVLALLLAAVGIYGVMAYLVTQRTREIGIRMALGASRADILRLILRHGLVMTLAGVAAGLGGALALSRLLSSLLFGVQATDAPTYAAVTLLLVLVALLACYVPARRATRVDPMEALRYE